MVRAKSQSHYFSPNSNVSLELGNFGEPCPPSSTGSAHTHAHTRDHKCNFSITFFFFFLAPPPLYRLRLILTDLRLKEETRIHIRSVSFKERAEARQLLPPPPRDPRCFLEEKFNLFPAGTRKRCAVSERTAGIRPHFSPCEGPVKIRGTF